MPKLDKGRQTQYRTKVAEDFPETLAIVDVNRFLEAYKNHFIIGFCSEDEQKLMERMGELLKSSGTTSFKKTVSCRYGQNPGGPAAFYKEIGASGPCTADIKLLQKGKGLGYINIADLDLSQKMTKSVHDLFGEDQLVATIVKHETPSGAAARGTDPLETYEKAWGTDTLSSFGGVVVLSYEVTPEVAEKIVIPSRNTEVLAAPSYANGALEILAKREPLRVIKMASFSEPVIDNGLEYKRTTGGLLVENRFQTKIQGPYDIDCISEAKPTESDINAALFAWHGAAHTRSNAVLIGLEDVICGIGSGQRSRIDSATNAIELSRRGYGPEGTFMASDAYMPATDVVELAAKEGVRGIIYPLGSNMDQKVLELANEHGLIMIATRKPGSTEGGERCFLHR